MVRNKPLLLNANDDMHKHNSRVLGIKLQKSVSCRPPIFSALSSVDFKLFPEAQQFQCKMNILTSLLVFLGKAVKLLVKSLFFRK
jgi:hypothetical protein